MFEECPDLPCENKGSGSFLSLQCIFSFHFLEGFLMLMVCQFMNNLSLLKF